MIFAKTIDLVLSGRKSQTLRLAYFQDRLDTEKYGVPAVLDSTGRARWIVGHSYAVQPERCHFALGRIVVTYLREVPNPLEVDAAFVHAEGFDTATEYLRIWHELHGKKPIQRCWAIGFVLADRGNHE